MILGRVANNGMTKRTLATEDTEDTEKDRKSETHPF